jgi:hypothetical protein
VREKGRAIGDKVRTLKKEKKYFEKYYVYFRYRLLL